MKIRIKTAHGYLSLQPDGRLEYRAQAGPWEEFDIEGLEALLGSGNTAGGGAAPAPEVDALLGCRYVAGHAAALVLCLHDAIRPAGSLEKAFEVTKRVAWGLRETGAGLLLKPGGDNIITWRGQSFAAARICWPNGDIVKVLTDVPTTNGPSWQAEGAVETDRYVPAIDPRT